jgi:hypothetical protein
MKQDPVKYSELILRLMSDNGDETFNEIVCHFGLANAFSTYGIYPLFSDAPDGNIGNDKEFANVEIKSRFSQLISKMENFYSHISMIFPCLEKTDIECNLNIIRLDKKISDLVLTNEINYLKSLVSNGNYCGHIETRKEEFIEYEIKILCGQTDGKPIVYFTKNEVNNCIYSTNTAQYLGNGKASGKTKVTVLLSESVREVYSLAIVKDCLDRIKNMPDEPRCIVIYSNILGDIYLIEFFKQVAIEYVKRKKGTAILGIFGQFLERTEENGVGVNKFAFGESITDLIEKNLRVPGSIK